MAKIRLTGDNNIGYTELSSSPNAANNTITFPANNGSANTFLRNSGTTGTLQWSSLVEDSSGKIGIGTASPISTLTLSTSTDTTYSGSGLGIISDPSGYTAIQLYEGGTTGGLRLISKHPTVSTFSYISLATGVGANATERLRIDSSGNVGIGTASPGAKLVVSDGGTSSSASGGTLARIIGSTVSRLDIVGGNSGYSILEMSRANLTAAAQITYEHSSNSMWFTTNGTTERLRIDSSGNVGIGTANAGTSTINLRIGNSGSGGGVVTSTISLGSYGSGYGSSIISSTNFTASTDSYLAFCTTPSGATGNVAPTERLRIDSSGRLLAGTSSARTDYFNGLGYGARITSESPGLVLNSYINYSAITNAASSEAPWFVFGKSRGSSAGSVTSVSSGDGLGTISFQGADGTNLIQGAAIAAIVESAPGRASMPTYFAFQTTASGSANPTERMRITSDGYLKVSPNGTYYATGTYNEIRSATNVALLLSSYYASTANLDIFPIYASSNANSNHTIIRYQDLAAGLDRFKILGNGNAQNTNGVYGAISDEKVKTDIQDAGSQWNDIKNLRVRKFRLKSDPSSSLMIGVVAQEAELVSPGLIEETPDYVENRTPVLDEEGNETGEFSLDRVLAGTTTKSVKYSVLYMKAIKALQEAILRIESLESEVQILKNK